MPAHRHVVSLALLLMIGTGAVLAAGVLVVAGDNTQDHARHIHGSDAIVPTMPGQDAFGAIQEIVRILEADPATDWSKVNIAALREHLIDMNRVTLEATAAERAIDGGVQIDGSGRTLAAIQRMLPAHARELNGLSAWRANTEVIADGVRLTVTSQNAAEITHIRGLGFIGLMVGGTHHQPHHLAIARGVHIH